MNALDESALLITVVWPHDFGVVNEEPTAARRSRRVASFCLITDNIEAAAGAEGSAA